MPLFNWDAAQGDSVMKERFYYYWAATLPLTFVVLLVWALCLLLPWRKYLAQLKMVSMSGSAGRASSGLRIDDRNVLRPLTAAEIEESAIHNNDVARPRFSLEGVAVPINIELQATADSAYYSRITPTRRYLARCEKFKSLDHY